MGLLRSTARRSRRIRITAGGVPGFLGIWEYLLDIAGTPSPDQQCSRATILAYDGQVAVVRHYPHLISRRVVSDLLITWTALPTTSAGRFSPLGPLGEDDPFRFKNLVIRWMISATALSARQKGSKSSPLRVIPSVRS